MAGDEVYSQLKITPCGPWRNPERKGADTWTPRKRLWAMALWAGNRSGRQTQFQFGKRLRGLRLYGRLHVSWGRRGLKTDSEGFPWAALAGWPGHLDEGGGSGEQVWESSLRTLAFITESIKTVDNFAYQSGVLFARLKSRTSQREPELLCVCVCVCVCVRVCVYSPNYKIISLKNLHLEYILKLNLVSNLKNK